EMFLVRSGPGRRGYVKVPGGEALMVVVIKVQGEADLVEVVAARRLLGRFADFLNGRHQQPDQHGDNGDHHQQLDERETAARAHSYSPVYPVEVDGQRLGQELVAGPRAGRDDSRTGAVLQATGPAVET